MNLTNVEGQLCGANWKHVGPEQHLRVEVMPRAAIVQKLGWVRPRRDGRWDWNIFVTSCSPFFRPRPERVRTQGVAESELEAKTQIEGYWRIQMGEVLVN